MVAGGVVPERRNDFAIINDVSNQLNAEMGLELVHLDPSRNRGDIAEDEVKLTRDQADVHAIGRGDETARSYVAATVASTIRSLRSGDGIPLSALQRALGEVGIGLAASRDGSGNVKVLYSLGESFEIAASKLPTKSKFMWKGLKKQGIYDDGTVTESGYQLEGEGAGRGDGEPVSGDPGDGRELPLDGIGATGGTDGGATGNGGSGAAAGGGSAGP